MTELTDADIAKVWHIAAVFAALGGVVMLHDLFFRYLWRHDVHHNTIKLRLFGLIPIDRLRLQDIEEIDSVSWWETHLTWQGLWTAPWGARLFASTYVVVMLSRRLWWRRRRYRMSPRDPDAVIRAVVLGEPDSPRPVRR